MIRCLLMELNSVLTRRITIYPSICFFLFFCLISVMLRFLIVHVITLSSIRIWLIEIDSNIRSSSRRVDCQISAHSKFWIVMTLTLFTQHTKRAKRPASEMNRWNMQIELRSRTKIGICLRSPEKYDFCSFVIYLSAGPPQLRSSNVLKHLK